MIERLQAGTRIKALSADSWNSFADAAEWVARQGRSGSVPVDEGRQLTVVKVRNDSGSDVQRFGILGLGAPIISPTDDEDTFVNNACFSGEAPVEPDHAGRFCVVLQPLADGDIGIGAIAGIVPVTLKEDATADTNKYADVLNLDSTALRACSEGSARIIWREAATGPCWALVDLDSGVQEAQPFGSEFVMYGAPGSEVAKLRIRAGYVYASEGYGTVDEYLENPASDTWYYVKYRLNKDRSVPTVTSTIQTSNTRPQWIAEDATDYVVYQFPICYVDSNGRLERHWTGGHIIAPQIDYYDIIDIAEGVGIDVVENPKFTWTVTSLIEEGECISLNEPAAGEAWVISVDLDCVLEYVELNFDWSDVPVCDSVEWNDLGTGGESCIHLVGDVAVPGDYEVYGYLDELAPRGWHDIRDFIADTDTIRRTSAANSELDLEVAYQYSIDADEGGLKLVNDEDEPAAYLVYGTDSGGTRGYQSITTFFNSSSTISKSGGSPALAEFAIEFTAESSVVDSGGVQLYNDENAPGTYHFYGVDGVASKGWQAFTAVTVITDIQLDGSDDLQVKTTEIYVFDPQSESAWGTIDGWTTTPCP